MSGIRTSDNFSAGQPAQFHFTGIGTSYGNGQPDQLRFTRLNTQGTAVLSNLGHLFMQADGKAFNANGNSVAEIRNAAGNGGYLAAGSVSSNTITGALAAGGSDVLISRLDANGFVVNASRIDISNGSDVAWSVKKSSITVNGQPTWIICGASRYSATHTDCFVARVFANGTIIWCRRYNFDPGAGQLNAAHCIAKQLCEDNIGNIYVVGTFQDNPAVANGIDGLAFKLNQAGVVLWVNNYHVSTVDEFQAVRVTADGNLIIGGFTNYTGSYNMLITKLASVSGNIIFRNILRANNNVAVLPTFCYDIIETPGPQYFLGGYVNNAGVYLQMMYRVNAAGTGISWNSYNPTVYKEALGLDYVPGNTPGVAFFSSMKNPANFFSDSHIMKTDLNARTCNFCTLKPQNTIAVNMLKVPRQWITQLAGTQYSLLRNTLNYSHIPICIQNPACLNTGDAVTAIESKAEAQRVLPGRIQVSPNPVAHTLRLQFSALPEGEYQLMLKDMEGRLVMKKSSVYNTGSSATSMDLSSVTPGVYLLTVSRKNLVLQQRIIKQ